MTIKTRNEVLVTCENTPLMELLEHLAQDHAPDLDYCLENLGLDYTATNEPREVSTKQGFLDLPLGTVVEIPHVGTYYKTALRAWIKPNDLSYSSTFYGNADLWGFTISVNAPARVLFTPEVQA